MLELGLGDSGWSGDPRNSKVRKTICDALGLLIDQIHRALQVCKATINDAGMESAGSGAESLVACWVSAVEV